MVFVAKRIAIKGVLLYLMLICKIHPKSKLGNNIIYTPMKPQLINQLYQNTSRLIAV